MSVPVSADVSNDAHPDNSLKALSYANYTGRAIQELIDNYAKDMEVLALASNAVDQLQAELKQARGDIDFRLLQLVGKRREVDLGLGWKVQRYAEPKEVWDDNKVRTALGMILAQHAIETQTGEVTLVVEHAERIVDVVLAIMGASKPKKQALKAHRIDPQTLYSLSFGDDKVRVVKPDTNVTPLRQDVVGGQK